MGDTFTIFLEKLERYREFKEVSSRQAPFYFLSVAHMSVVKK